MICCVVAALGYSGVNVCSRVLTVRCDRSLILFTKESFTAACVAAWLAYGMYRGKVAFPGWRGILKLAAVGILTQMAASLPMLWSMAVIGLAIAVTLSLGASLFTCVVLGRVVLKERVSPQSLLAVALLVMAVGFLTFGAQDSSLAVSSTAHYPPWMVLLATAMACLAGAVYGLLNVAVRRSVTGGMPPGIVALVIPLMGTVCMGPACLWNFGPSCVFAMPASDLLVVLVSGVLNVIAWFAFIRGLETTNVVNANVLTASQVAMAAVAGVLFFQETASPALVFGVAMTIAGMVSVGRPPA